MSAYELHHSYFCDKWLKNLVLGRDTWGLTLASNQVDSFGKQLLKEFPFFFYKKEKPRDKFLLCAGNS